MKTCKKLQSISLVMILTLMQPTIVLASHKETVDELITKVHGDLNAALEGAIHNSNVQHVKEIIKKGVDLTHINSDGYLPLHSAVAKGDGDVVYELLKTKGVDKNARVVHGKHKGMTALHLATMKCHQEVIRCLSYVFVELEARDGDDLTPLQRAAKSGDALIVKVLLDCWASIEACNGNNSTSLHLAAENGHAEVVKVLLGRGAQKNAQDKWSKTSLHLTAENGHTKVVKVLLGRGAQKDVQDKWGKTPLHKAAENSHTEVIKVLLKNHVRKDIQDKDGKTPLFIAAQRGHKAVIKLLLSEDTNTQLVDNDGTTLLHIIAARGYEELVPSLSACINVGVKDKAGWTPLHYAAAYGHAKVIQALLAGGALVNVRGKSNSTPLHCIAQKSDFYTYGHFLGSLLTSFKLNAVAGIIYQYITKDIICYGDHEGALKALLRADAHKELEDNDKLTPRELALQCSYDKVAKLLS